MPLPFIRNKIFLNIRKNKVSIVCPSCKKVYNVDNSRIPLNKRRTAKCSRCKASFFVIKRSTVLFAGPQEEDNSYIRGYVEKRSGLDRRLWLDRRSEGKFESFPFRTPDRDFIPIIDKEGHPIGYYSPGRRNGADRRGGEERRYLS
jgi:predicted Zn finger-like uncharacterized protein